ncbi:MBL fold metallo-hydrolase [Pontiella sulfatireligans]|uniref:Phosphoribosyl 1,2-cyclic phosphate phosphodiesterase n=1 Tax=Pontiella sulfatireligans TaxID=2750658 RepID=A0A6C2USB9_9BACT|nr:MBL fold metallo-hydrolase [Pontiella sulfatireligans]VGO22154.1 Phosphoribosyl 1,2-cyclic phosphate phosphodiesterase [Pontiella sulfatireligans]
MKFTFLGTGTSHGIPMIGCSCSVCTSTDLKNKRRRCSLYVVAEGQHLIFDTPPDFRDQVLNFGVERVDAVFLTHPHADHIYGFDDVRRFSDIQNGHIPVYGSPRTIKQMRKKFDYVDRKSHSFGGVPRVRFTDQTEPVEIGGAVMVTPLPVSHGKDIVYGFLVEAGGVRIAYIPDCNGIPETTFELLENMNAMILDGLRPQKHPTHFSTGECIEQLERIGAKRSFITHLTHNSEHHSLQQKLGEAATVPWDGLQIVL